MGTAVSIPRSPTSTTCARPKRPRTFSTWVARVGRSVVDLPLAPADPVHRGVELVLVDLAESELVTEGGDRTRWIESTGRAQLGARIDDAGCDHGHGQVAHPARLPVDQPLGPDAFEGAEYVGHMTVGEAAHATEALGGIDEGLALQGAANEVDDVVGEVGDIAEGFVLDLAVIPGHSAVATQRDPVEHRALLRTIRRSESA